MANCLPVVWWENQLENAAGYQTVLDWLAVPVLELAPVREVPEQELVPVWEVPELALAQERQVPVQELVAPAREPDLELAVQDFRQVTVFICFLTATWGFFFHTVFKF